VSVPADRRELAAWLRDAWNDGATGCPPPEAFLEAELQTLTPDQRRTLEAHAETCPACRAERELAQAFDSGAEGVSAEDVAWVVGHLRGETDTLPAPAPAAEAPSFTARETRPTAPGAGIPAGGRLVPFQKRRQLPTWTRLAAAAVLTVGIGLTLFTVYDRNPPLPPPPGSGLVRGGEVEALSPLGEVAAMPGELRWQPFAGAVGYRVRLVAVDGRTLWEGRAAAPPALLPAPVIAGLRRSVSYDWSVEALAGDGKVLGRSTTTRFRIRALPESAQPETTPAGESSR
jgi:hypothetical protein